MRTTLGRIPSTLSKVAERCKNPSNGWPSVVLAAAVYAALIGIIWGTYGLYSGMGYETAFPYQSSTSTWWRGFLYVSDLLRIFTSVFYHLAYLIGRVLGIDGSYVPFQVVYALLWWARGMLVFLIVRRFLPGETIFSYVAGAFALVHAEDGSLGWVGQMNQFGFIFWMLLAYYFLVEAVCSNNALRTTILTAMASFFELMSLFSYESPLFLLLVFPAALMALRQPWRRMRAVAAAWYVVPGVYILLAVNRYLLSKESSYQTGVLRKNWGWGGLISDWWFNISASLRFWQWLRPGLEPPKALALAAAVLVMCGGLGMLLLMKGSGRQRMFSLGVRSWLLFLITGLGAVALSFPAYLLLGSARGLWRTQLLSGIGAAVVFTALLGLVSYKLPWRAAKLAVVLAGAAAVVYCGSLGAVSLERFHREVWETHRAAITEVLRIAPSVKPNAVIVLTNVPKDEDPFGHDMWFDMAIRLVYPKVPVAGLYYYSDGTRAPGDTLAVAGDRWKWDHVTGYPPAIDDSSLANTVVIRYDKSGTGTLERDLPRFVSPDASAADLYRPYGVITGPVAPSAVRRYRLRAPAAKR